jgi:hypothetical protein
MKLCDAKDENDVLDLFFWGLTMKSILSVLNLLWMFSFLNTLDAQEVVSYINTHDGFYRALGFRKIEKICFQLHDDLDLMFLNKSPSSLKSNPGYLLKQFCYLFTAIQELVDNTEEARMFLPDDIVYLLDHIQKIEHKLFAIEVEKKSEDQLVQCMGLLLRQSQQKLQVLIENNIEIVFEPTMLEQHLIQC